MAVFVQYNDIAISLGFESRNEVLADQTSTTWNNDFFSYMCIRSQGSSLFRLIEHIKMKAQRFVDSVSLRSLQVLPVIGYLWP